MSKLKAESGFSLLEVLVAFLVLSITLGIIFQIVSLSSRITRTAEIQQQALLLAESKMAEILSTPEVEPGRDWGRFSFSKRDRDPSRDFQWQTNISVFEFPEQSLIDSSDLVPYLFQVSVSWSDQPDQVIELQTVRLERQI